MNADHHPDGARAGLPARALAAVALIFLCLAAVYAFSTTFSKFAPYDDEGFMMISVRGFLEGHALYQEVTAYGPCYYLYEWLLHGLASLPLTHDVTRSLCVVHWVAAAALLGLAGGVMTRSFMLALFIFLQGVVRLSGLANEPGHPQELVVVLLALSILATANNRWHSWMLPFLGMMTAALAFTKINVGAFFGFALALTLLCQTSFFQTRRGWFCALLAVSSLLPFALMRQQIAEGWARAYAWQSCAAILGAGMASAASSERRKVGWQDIISVTIGFCGASAFLLALPILTGTSLAGVLDGVILGAIKFPSVFCLPLITADGSWSGLAAVLGAVFVVIFRGQLSNARLLVIVAKGIYGLAGALVLFLDERSQFAYLLPWGWLLVLPTNPGSSWDGREGFARLFLCLLATWQSLQAYPVAGTQVDIAMFLPVLVYSLCLHDAITALAREPRCSREGGVPPQPAIFSRTLTTRGRAWLQVLLLLLLLWFLPLEWTGNVAGVLPVLIYLVCVYNAITVLRPPHHSATPAKAWLQVLLLVLLRLFVLERPRANIATFLSVLIYSLSLYNAIAVMAAAPHRRSRREDRSAGDVDPDLPTAHAVPARTFGARLMVWLQVLFLILLVRFFAFEWCDLGRAWDYYADMKPLKLPGSRLLRLPSSQVGPYHELAQYLASSCDTFLIYPGFNSFYFWTGKPPPTYLNMSGEAVLLSQYHQQRVVSALRRAERPLVVVNDAQALSVDGYAPSHQGPLLHFLHEEWQEVKRVGPFRILAHKAAPVPAVGAGGIKQGSPEPEPFGGAG